MKKVTIIGGGGTGHTLAADLSRRGFDVSLCEEPGYAESLEAVSNAGGIEITGALEPGFVAVESVSTDLERVVPDADIILVSVVANRHAGLARTIEPMLRDGQSVVIGPDNGGSLVFANEFRRLGSGKNVLLGGLGGNYYACRLTGPAKVFVGMPRRTKTIAAFPALYNSKLIASLDGLFDWTAGTDVLEMALSTPNIPNHLAGAILNTGAIESSGGKFNLFRDGLSPSVVRCIDAVSGERNAILRALGYGEIESDMLRNVAQLDQFPELDTFRDLGGPSDMQHRYVTEDAEVGISLLVSLGHLLRVETPVSEGLLTLASTINETDYYEAGRRFLELGIKCNTIPEIRHYLESGVECEPAGVPPLF